MDKINLKIVTPERTLLEEKVSEILLHTAQGQIAILPHHTSLVSEIMPGEIIVRSSKDEKIALVYGGFLHVQPHNEVIILADSAEHLHELNEAEIIEAKKRAEDIKAGSIGDKERLAEAEAELARISTQLRVVNKHRNLKARSHKNIKNIIN